MSEMFGACGTSLNAVKEKRESCKWEHHTPGKRGSKNGNGKENIGISIYLTSSVEF